jgi:transcriptional regulator with XRE-family HTH domain
MNVGEKIRELRLAKLMTQAELAGDHITRNMLS